MNVSRSCCLGNGYTCCLTRWSIQSHYKEHIFSRDVGQMEEQKEVHAEERGGGDKCTRRLRSMGEHAGNEEQSIFRIGPSRKTSLLCVSHLQAMLVSMAPGVAPGCVEAQGSRGYLSSRLPMEPVSMSEAHATPGDKADIHSLCYCRSPW